MARGILVHSDNHFIVDGPKPSPGAALRLVRRWSVIQIGSGIVATGDDGWRMVTREYRERLEWAVVVAGERPPQPAVVDLLNELRARGIRVEQWPGEPWPGED
jgi:hypothetical protein